MTDSTAITPGAAGAPDASAGAETIDLLIRHLETAKQIVSAPSGGTHELDGGDAAFVTPDQICTLLYASSGVFCPLFYVHGS